MTDYNALKVTELKELLKERGIPSTGLSRKQLIIEALEAHDANNPGTDAAVEEQGNEGEQEVSEDVEVPDAAPAQHASGEEENEAKVVEATADITAQDGGSMTAVEGLASEVEPSAAPTDVVAVESTISADELPSEPTVLEKNEPVSKEPSVLNTPQRTSPGAESQSSDTRKRKRRSPTPPPSQDTVNKKLKFAEAEVVKLPEDRQMESPTDETVAKPEEDAVEQSSPVRAEGESLGDKMVADAPIPVDDNAQSERKVDNATTVVPYSVSDDVMEVSDKPVSSEPRPRSDTPAKPPTSRSYMEARQEAHSIAPVAGAEDAGADITTSPAIHPATRTLYIRDLLRPLQPQQFRDHLVDLATPPRSSLDPRIIEIFHLDALRTHAFVTFTSTSAASRARSALHGHIWPDEPARKALWVDFVPDEKVQDWIDTELSAGTNRRDAKKWEVDYSHTADGVTATLQEAAVPPSGPAPMRQPSFSSSSGPGPAGPGMPNAPLGPRASRPSTSSQQPPPQPAKRPTPSTSSFDILDQRFSHTTAKPKLYYLPLSKDLVDKRLDEFEALTSRTWDGGRAMQGVGAVEGQLRRYTFEDGERVVDNGPDIGSFGRGSPRGGRGRGRGGGFRGRR